MSLVLCISSENIDVFRRYRKRPVTSNGLMKMTAIDDYETLSHLLLFYLDPLQLRRGTSDLKQITNVWEKLFHRLGFDFKFKIGAAFSLQTGK